MSYQPYLPPPAAPSSEPYPGAWGEALAPLRQASALQFIVAGLVLVLGMCSGIGLSLPLEQVQRQLDEVYADAPPGPRLNAETARILQVVFVTAEVALGLVLAWLATSVRRGSRAGTIASAVIVGAVTLLVGGMALLTLLAGVIFPPALAMACLLAVAASLLGMLSLRLIQALLALKRVADLQRQWQAQWWQYQQQHAATTGVPIGSPTGWSYAAQVPAPAPPAPIQQSTPPP